MKKILPWVLALSACAPIVFIPQTLNPAIIGKNMLYFLLVGIGLCGASYLFYRDSALFERLRVLARQPLARTLALLTIVYGVTTLFSYDPQLSFYGEGSRGEGFVVFFVLAVLAYLIALFFERKHWQWFFGIGTVLIVPVFIRSIVEIAHGFDRPYSYIGNPIFLAAWYLLASFGGVFLIAQKKSYRMIGVLSILLAVLGIFLTMSRGVIVGVFAGLVIAGGTVVFMKSSAQVRKIGYWMLGGVLAFLVVFAMTYRQSFWQNVPGINRIADGNTTTLTSRLLYIGMTVDGFTQEPLKQKLVGWGWDNAEVFLNKYYNPAVYRYDAGNPDRVHNKFADMLAMTGILGLVAYLMLLYQYLRSAWKIARTDTVIGVGLLSIGSAYIVQNMFSFDIPILTFSFYSLIAYMMWYQYEKKT